MKYKTLINILIGLLIAVILFHIAIIVKVIPYNIAWGGRIQNDSEMYVFEAFSILVNLFLITIILIKGNYLKFRWHEKLINVVLWIFFFIFILNTIGNILAKSNFEKLFSILTLILALLIWNILIKKKPNG